MYRKAWLLLLLLFNIQLLSAQGKFNLTDDLEAFAEYAYEQGDYHLAFPHFYRLNQEYPNNLGYKLKLGVCYLHKRDDYSKALPLFLDLYQIKPKTKDILFYIGQAYHKNMQFNEALSWYAKYEEEGGSSINQELVDLHKSYSENGKKLIVSPVNFVIENFGHPVNTTGDEYVPVLSSDETVLIFTYRGENSSGGKQNPSLEEDSLGDFYEDIFISKKIDGSWTIPTGIGEGINNNGHDAAIALSADGQKLFIYRASLTDGGDIYMSLLEGNTWSSPVKLDGGINTPYWEGSVSLSSDERTLYFSSERPGGYGGKDLYKARMLPDGTWGEVENLGSRINTKYDEDAPFIHPDGSLFTFSSNGPGSMGGFDIFSCNLKKGEWTDPVNMGFPVNGVSDDIYYFLSADGERGFYSSGKPGGKGRQDLYVVSPGTNGPKPVVVQVKGTVTVDDKPVGADIAVNYLNNGREHGRYRSNTITGKYLINLPAGTDYTIKYEIDGHDPEVREIRTIEVDEFQEVTMDKAIVTEEYAEVKRLQEEARKVVPVDQFKHDGLRFTVQIAAYNLPDNYNFSPLSSLGEPEKRVLEDGITRFTLGSFETLSEAEEFKGRVIGLGQTDAFVTAIYNGKRVYIEEFYNEILNTNIPGRD